MTHMTRVLLSIVALTALALQSSFAESKRLPFPGKTLKIDGHDGFLILPENPKAPTSWIWYAPTLPKHPDKAEAWMFKQLLDKGIAIAGVDVGESYGSPDGRAIYSKLYEELTTKHGLAKKPCLLTRSRGGLMLYNWAAENTDKVAGIAGLYPVCNLRSYPGLKRACGAFNMTAEELEKNLDQHNPIARLAPLAKAKIPLHHLHGDSDTVVPLEANSAIMKKRYDKLGGKMTLEVIKGGGHDMNRHWFENQAIVDFMIGAVSKN